MEDNKILELLWNRLDSAIDALAERFGQRLYQTAMNILGNRQDAEEAVNDTYLALWNAIPPERPEPLAGYVHRTGRNVALKKLRFQSAQKRSSQYDLSLDELAEIIPGNTLEEALDTRVLGQTINSFLGTLNETNRNIFLRRYWFGDNIAQISALVSLGENAVSVRLSRMRSSLKEYLQKEGILL